MPQALQYYYTVYSLLMCGLTGFFDLSGRRHRAEMHDIITEMVGAIDHRGPDSQDVWQDPDVHLALGHSRLAIIDLSPAGAQPMVSSCGRYVIVYNGEIYNADSLRKDLDARGIELRGHSDTEILLESFAVQGVRPVIERVVGMFAFVLWDRKSRTLTIARDRLGQKPFYIGWAGEALVFGSELKSICCFPDFKASLSEDGFSHYLRYGCVGAPYSIYDQIWQLMPGYMMELPIDHLRAGRDLLSDMHAYWSLEDYAAQGDHSYFDGGEDEALDGFASLLSDAVRRRMVSDVPLGSFLSGGIDSSLVTAVMQSISAQKIKTYSIGFEDQGYDESHYAAKIADHLGTDHNALIVSERDVQAVIPSLPDMYDEPLADISCVPTYLLSRFARSQVSVALSGDGGDELLGGYTRHQQIPKLWSKFSKLPKSLRRVVPGIMQGLPPQFLDFAFGRVMAQASRGVYKASYMVGARDAMDMYERARAVGKGLTQDYARDFSGLSDDLSLQEKIILRDAQSYLPDMVLAKVDRASMACALEARSPLLDHRLFEYTARLPLAYKICGGQGKYLMRRMLDRYVPPALFERPKQGFNMPVGSWLRGDLRDWAEALLSHSSLRGSPLEAFVDVDAVGNQWNAFVKTGRGDVGFLWSILMAQTWFNKWL